MIRPRAADDFAAIRARVEELRRERDRLSAEQEPLPLGTIPCHPAHGQSKQAAPRRLPHAIRRRLFRN